MALVKSRIILLAAALALLSAGSCLAAPIMIRFTAAIDTGNSIDAADIFGEGAGADLTGQVVSGTVTIDPAALTALSVSGRVLWRLRRWGDLGQLCLEWRDLNRRFYRTPADFCDCSGGASSVKAA